MQCIFTKNVGTSIYIYIFVSISSEMILFYKNVLVIFMKTRLKYC